MMTGNPLANLTRMIVVVALAVLASACGAVRGELVETGMADRGDAIDSQAVVFGTEAPKPNSDDASDADAIPVGDAAIAEAFDFVAPDLYTGAAFSGAELFSNGSAIISFVVPDCVVCNSEAPELALSAEQNPDVTYVFVHSFSTDENYITFAEDHGLYHENIVHLQDSAGHLWTRFGVVQQPTTLLVDTESRMTMSIGALEHEGIAAAVIAVT